MVKAMYRSLRPAHAVGDLARRQSDHVAQHHNFALLVRERGERRSNRLRLI